MKFDRRLTDEIYTSDTVRLGKNAFQAMRETIYHNGGVSFRGASGEMILHRLDLKKILSRQDQHAIQKQRRDILL